MAMGKPRWTLLVLCFFFTAFPLADAAGGGGIRVCIIGAGIGGSSLSHFLKDYSAGAVEDIFIFEKNGAVGGRMATITLAGDTIEAGGTILHPKNLHALNFTALLDLNRLSKSAAAASSRGSAPSSSWLGIWDGSRFVFQTLRPPDSSSSALYRKIYPILSSLLIFRRYGISLLRMQSVVQKTVGKFMMYYGNLASRPIFETAEEMLRWTGLHGLTRKTLREELLEAGVSPRLISELVTVITRVNYGQSVEMSGLAGAVALAGSDSGLWSVQGGNWQMAAGLIKRSNATLNLGEEITAISYKNGKYELLSKKGNQYICDVAAIATPLDELNISFFPPISIPGRRLQHTHATFVRGLLNPGYFGLNSETEIPHLVGTMEMPELPFSSIGVQKIYSENDKAYKVFSRAPMEDGLLDQMFSVRRETVRIDWAAYPHYSAPEVFAPYLLDGLHLYYINSFESAASTMETSAVAAENIARLILSRISEEAQSRPGGIRVSPRFTHAHVDL